MAHIEHNTTKSGRTLPEWLPIGSQIAQMANTWADRNDLVVFIGEGATEGHAPALFKPAIAEIEVNVEKAFGFGVEPRHIGNFTERSTRYEFPRATGAVMHEAFHARFSRWSIPEAFEALKQDEFDALMLLEESRIEARGMIEYPASKLFLRSCALDLVLGDVSDESIETLNVASAVRLIALLNGRIVAGILNEEDFENVISKIKLVVDEVSFNRFLEILQEFQNYGSDTSMVGAYPLAIEWAELTRKLKEQNGESEDGGCGIGGVSLADILDELADIAIDIEIENTGSLSDQETAEEWKETVEKRNKEADTQNKNKKVAETIFKPSKTDDADKEDSDDAKSTSDGFFNGSDSRLKEVRSPNGAEHRTAVTIARMLEQAKYRERDITTVTSQVPSGKLRTSAVIQNEALKAKGMLPTANTWKRKVRKQTDEPKLSVGVMVDISGSMSDAMQPMASTAWIMSEAVRRVQGRTAMVYFGSGVFPTLKAGQHLDKVSVYSAPDGTEKFDTAFRALDGSLDLLYGNGVRLLVVVSDGVYTNEETRKAKDWVRECERNGVAVLWLTFAKPNRTQAEDICQGTKAVVVSGTLNPTDVAVEIGKAMAKALEITSRVA